MKIRTLLGLLSILPLSAVHADTECLKLVFEQYCLGGSLDRQLQTTPVAMRPITKGQRSGIIINDHDEKIYVMAFNGRIYKVLRTYRPETPTHMKTLRRELERSYGGYQDQSEYPDNSKNRARQISSIRRGEGELKNVWRLKNKPWRVELGWTRKLGLHIAYLVNELDAQQQAAELKGL